MLGLGLHLNTFRFYIYVCPAAFNGRILRAGSLCSYCFWNSNWCKCIFRSFKIL